MEVCTKFVHPSGKSSGLFESGFLFKRKHDA